MRLVPDVTPILIHLTIYLEVLVKFPDQWLVGVCVCVTLGVTGIRLDYSLFLLLL